MQTGRPAASLASGLFVGVAIGWVAVASPRVGRAPVSDSPPDVIADSLIGLWIDSLGGMETYERFQSATYTVNTVLYDTLSGRVRRSRPRYVWIKKGPKGLETRVERWEPYGFVTQGFDGQAGWAALDGAMLPDTAKDWREVPYVAGDLSYWPGLPYKLRDEGVFLAYRGMRSRPGAEFRPDPKRGAVSPPRNGYHTVAVSFGEGVGDHQDSWHYYFEPGKGFPTEVTYLEDGSTTTNRVIWGETMRFGSIRYPFVERRDFITDSGKRTKALVISDVVINPDIPEPTFERPTPPTPASGGDR